ncbi:MAG TPA: DNA-processing protein DprA [Bacteroidota bacterium]|nr:DNA-processing protein DprA [Bacteroidota bacterium]
MISLFDLLVLSQIPNIGPHRLRNLVTHFEQSSNIFQASAREIATVDGFSKKLAVTCVQYFRNSQLDEAKLFAERQLSKLNKIEGDSITYWDKNYPESLKKIYDAPPWLFVRGKMRSEDKYALAIIGTRSPSEYGLVMTERFSQELAKLGITIVSGLARGIDTMAHQSAVKTGGRTIAVIGSGLDIIYPPENRNLSERIVQHGAIITEFEMGTKPDAGNFPRRNRIISGLSLGVLVVETDVNGGAMITASMALDQNREVFALPGNIGAKKSRGSNALIRDGRAKLVESVDDILLELSSKLRPLLKDSTRSANRPAPELTLFEKSVYDVLSDEPRHIDVIAESAKILTSDALVHLLSLEFKGSVKQLPGKLFIRV